jgi:AcrR family transcriptional regulator
MQQRSEATRKRILESASRLFAQSGYTAGGVAEICEAAGVSKGAYYHHFPSKQAVFMALLDEWLAGLDQAFAGVQEQEQDVPKAILQMADLSGRELQPADTNLNIILEFWLQAARDPAVWQASIDHYRRYTDYFSDLFQKGIAQGTLRRVNPDLAARTMVALAMGLLLQAILDPKGADWPSDIHQSIGQVLEGMKR